MACSSGASSALTSLAPVESSTRRSAKKYWSSSIPPAITIIPVKPTPAR